MKNQTLKALTNAHAWVGLMISTMLFLVFFAGSISLFRDNLMTWEKVSMFTQQNQNIDNYSFDNAVRNIQDRYDVYMHHAFYVYPPTEGNPFVEVYFAKEIEGIHPETGEDHEDVNLLLDPHSGEIIAQADQINFANFVYRLHYNLGIGTPGLYFLGTITLFFFVAIISGTVIHWRKIAKNFFQYRKDGKKDKWLDAHNMIGVMGLPFHIMYAFTGLVFNMVVIYQISYAVLLYGGSQEAILDAAGFDQPHIEEVGRPMSMEGLDALNARAMSEMGDVTLRRIMIEHFGDENAVAIYMMKSNDAFSNQKEVRYQMKDGEQVYVTHNNYDNAVRAGLSTIASLHFGDFAGYGMRIAFFLMGLATAYIIVTGNLMWIDKRAKQKKQSQRSLNFVRRLTAGGFIGVIFAIALGFVASHLFALSDPDRMANIKSIVYLSFAASLVIAQLMPNLLLFSRYLLRLSALIFAGLVVYDLMHYVAYLDILSGHAMLDIFITDAMLIVLSAICFAAAKRVKPAEQKQRESAAVDEDAPLIAAEQN